MMAVELIFPKGSARLKQQELPGQLKLTLGCSMAEQASLSSSGPGTVFLPCLLL